MTLADLSQKNEIQSKIGRQQGNVKRIGERPEMSQ
jgi:hypothetical protein